MELRDSCDKTGKLGITENGFAIVCMPDSEILMSVHCCEIDAYHYHYLIMTSHNAVYMISMVGTASISRE